MWIHSIHAQVHASIGRNRDWRGRGFDCVAKCVALTDGDARVRIELQGNWLGGGCWIVQIDEPGIAIGDGLEGSHHDFGRSNAE